jgi:N-methylhydantoinase A/oxoprolinase/acetone carboxylase beta subunit
VHAVVRLRRPAQAVQEGFERTIAEAGLTGVREIFWPDRMQRVESRVFDGTMLRHGNRVEGPAIVELPFTSIPVAGGQALECDAFGNFMLRLDGSAPYGSGFARSPQGAAV